MVLENRLSKCGHFDSINNLIFLNEVNSTQSTQLTNPNSVNSTQSTQLSQHNLVNSTQSIQLNQLNSVN